MAHEEKFWQAIERRDRGADGQFVFGVMTTGVYCRPSCPSRRPLRKNVRFYSTPKDAERDGLRPCLRCRPLENDSRIAEACRFIEAHPDERLDLAALAAHAGLSRFHFLRSFKAATGITPRQYVEACRLRRLKHGLREAKDVTEAVYDAGYGSSSRVYERADTRLGMTPREYRRGGSGIEITYAAFDSPLGKAMLGATDRGICFLQFGANEEELLAALRREYPAAQLQAMDRPARAFREWIAGANRLLEGTPGTALPLDVQGTAFQMRVWNYLQSIPPGEVRSYTDVAKGIGEPAAVRAVASACARNRVAAVIPCHRVVRGSGALGGYKWGLERKRALLEAERGLA